MSIVDEIIVIQSVVHDESKVLDVDSLITLEDKTIVGRVFEVFGSVKAPLYSIRFNDKSEINQDLLGKQVFIVDSFSKYVFTNTIKDKGSDASNLHDEEVEDNEKEFSDDEQEQEFKKRTKRKNGVQDEYETVIDSSIYDPLAELVNEDLHIPPAPVHSKKFQKNTQKSAPKVQNRYQGNNNRNNQNNHSNHQGNQNNHQGNNQINYQSNQGNYQGTQGNKHQRNDQRQRNNNNSNNNSSKPLHISPLNQPQSQQQMSIEQHHQMAAFQFQQMAMFHQQMIAQSQGSNGNQPGMMHGSINSGFGNFNQFNQMQGIQQNNSFPMQGFGNFNQNGIPGFPMPMNSQMPIIPMINQQFTAPVSAAVSKPHPIANINQSIPTPMFPGSTAGSSGFPAMPKTMNPFAPMTPVIEADKIDFGFNTNQGQTINGSRRYGSFNGGV